MADNKTIDKRNLTEITCYDCGKTMQGRRENYTYSECGLRSVILLNILVFHCECGSIVPEIPAPSFLHVSIAMSVLKKKTLLSGDEVRFLRKVAGYSATELSKVIGMTNTTVSHWETASKQIGKDADRLVRLSCFARIIFNLAGDNDLMLNMGRLEQVTKELNLTSVLEHIENRHAGPKLVKINPEGFVNRLRENIATVFATYTGISVIDAEALMISGATILNAQEALTKTIIHEVRDAAIPPHTRIVAIGNG